MKYSHSTLKQTAEVIRTDIELQTLTQKTLSFGKCIRIYFIYVLLLLPRWV